MRTIPSFLLKSWLVLPNIQHNTVTPNINSKSTSIDEFKIIGLIKLLNPKTNNIKNRINNSEYYYNILQVLPVKLHLMQRKIKKDKIKRSKSQKRINRRLTMINVGNNNIEEKSCQKQQNRRLKMQSFLVYYLNKTNPHNQ